MLFSLFTDAKIRFFSTVRRYRQLSRVAYLQSGMCDRSIFGDFSVIYGINTKNLQSFSVISLTKIAGVKKS
jgi:mevalonate pyrophosphate decarboxylase